MELTIYMTFVHSMIFHFLVLCSAMLFIVLLLEFSADHYVIKVSSSSARELIDNFDSQQTVIEMAMVEPYTMNVDAGEYVVLNLTIPDELDGIPFFYAAVVCGKR